MPLLDPLSFLDLAQDLAADGGEVRLRTAVGRAYYALFLLAREKTGALSAKKDESAHTLVIRAVRKQRGWAVANRLYALKELRLVADYQLLPVEPANRDWERNWIKALRLARRVLPELQSL